MPRANNPYYQICLEQELGRRCERNSNYSLRAFARALDIDPGALSRILGGKLIPSAKTAQKVFKTLGLAPQEQHHFLESIALTYQDRGFRRISPLLRKLDAQASSSSASVELSLEYFKVISDWHHAAILELTFTDSFKSDPKWIAAELGISPAQSKLALSRLLRLGLLVAENGKIKKSQDRITTRDKHLTSPALRRLQKSYLERAINSLENDPIEDRSMTAMTMAIAPENLPRAKKLIEEFTNQVCDLLEDGKQKRVYNLSVALFPLQRANATVFNLRREYEPEKV